MKKTTETADTSCGNVPCKWFYKNDGIKTLVELG